MISIAHPALGIEEEEEAVLRVLKISSCAMQQSNWHIFTSPIRDEVTTW